MCSCEKDNMVGIENLTGTDQQTAVAGTYTLLTLNNHIWRTETLIKGFRWPISEVILDNRQKPASGKTYKQAEY